ncbi:MAG TPA: M20/M25/M40 family metallo-hydrolase [Anaerolineales bacterium]|jgi:endoglucanase|nr:M20/M25/M40 family metallo-hydrolase [Anaerolineales bacterium]
MPTFGAPQLKLLERLCNAIAVSGDESEVRKIVLEEVKPYADDVKVDALGSVLVTKNGRGRKRVRVMLDAHMDEVGFMVVDEDGEGLYRFETVGGIDVRLLVGKQVVVGKERVPGVIGAKPIHLMSADEYSRKVPLDSLRIDVGLAGKAKVGDRAGFATRFRRVGPSILAKSIDDRIGVATLIELVKQVPSNIDLCAAFSVQEEIGLRGAKVAAQYFNPDLAIAIDSTPANDLPLHDGSENMRYNTKLGLGPAIYVADGSTLHDPRLVRFLRETAEAEGIPCQIRQPGGGGTDSGAIQRSLAGIPTVSVSVPHRYTHSPVSIARVDDWKHTLELFHAALKRITPDVVAAR